MQCCPKGGQQAETVSILVAARGDALAQVEDDLYRAEMSRASSRRQVMIASSPTYW